MDMYKAIATNGRKLPTFLYYMQMLVQSLSYFVVGGVVNEPWGLLSSSGHPSLTALTNDSQTSWYCGTSESLKGVQ